MINIVNIISTAFDKAQRRIPKFLRLGRGDVQTAFECSPSGLDSNPIPKKKAIYLNTGDKGKDVIVGYISQGQKAGIGEIRLYSTDDEGAEKTFLWLKNDGNLEVNGSDDNLARFSELKKGHDQLVKDHNALLNKFNLHIHPFVGLAVGVPGVTSVTTSTDTPSTSNIDGAKIDNVKTN